MNFLDFDDEPQEARVEANEAFNPENPAAGRYDGMEMDIYQSAHAINNSGLMLIGRNPADYIWNKNAPKDPSKVGAADFGTVMHTALLEPELFEGSFLIGPTKSRTTKAFLEFEQEHNGKIILLEDEYDKIRLSVDSAKAHPTVSAYLEQQGFSESSFFVADQVNGVMRKVRPDKYIGLDCDPRFSPALDVKTTASIADWRDSAKWKNPLYTFGYGHTAAFYMDTLSIHEGVQINSYDFLLVQKTSEFGMYPVSVFRLTREEAQWYGFFDQVSHNIETYAECLRTGNWFGVEQFPEFPIESLDDTKITYVTE